ncbi:hypothetical protein ACO1O0_004657 [Amphichorda felina]
MRHQTEISNQLPEPRRMEDKVAHVVKSAKEVGFQDLDSMVAEYYTGTFDVMSQAHEWQRKSRSRALGPLLHAIATSAKEWSEYECQGYRGETFKAAEQLYRSELQNAIDNGVLLSLTELDQNKLLGQTPREALNAEKGTLESQEDFVFQ